MEENIVSKGDIIYYARILPNVQEYDVIPLKIRMVADTWFSGYEDKTSHAYVFNFSDIGNIVFINRGSALDLVKEKESEYRKEK